MLIKRHGFWEDSCLEIYYLKQFPRTTLRVLSGHPKGPRCYFNARELVIPSENLQSQVFTWLNPRLPSYERHKRRPRQQPRAVVEEPTNGDEPFPLNGSGLSSGLNAGTGNTTASDAAPEANEILNDDSVGGSVDGAVDSEFSIVGSVGLLCLIDTLLLLRIVVLQDSVQLMTEFPDLFCWDCPLFKSAEFIQFADESRRAMDIYNSCERQRVEINALPELVATAVRGIGSDMSALKAPMNEIREGIREGQTSIGTALGDLGACYTALSTNLFHVMNGVALQLNDIQARLGHGTASNTLPSLLIQSFPVIPPLTQPVPASYKMRRDPGMSVGDVYVEWTHHCTTPEWRGASEGEKRYRRY